MKEKSKIQVRAGLATVHTAIGLSVLLGVVGICYLLISRQSSNISSINPTPSSSLSTSTKTLYTDAKHGYSLSHPSDWKIDEERSTEDDVVFNDGIPGRESIKVTSTTMTLDQWANIKTAVEKKTSLTVDGEPALRVETTEFGLNYIGVIKGGFLYEFTTGGRMIENGLLSSFKFSSKIDYNIVKVGDKIGTMSVVKITDERVIFSGQVTVTGKYHHYDSGELNGLVCIDMTGQDESLAKLPYNASPDDRFVDLCLNGKETASNNFGAKGSDGTATVTIDNYSVIRYGVSGGNTADLVKTIEKK